MENTLIKKVGRKKNLPIIINNKKTPVNVVVSYISMEFPLTEILSQLEFLAASKETSSAYEDMLKILDLISNEYPFKGCLNILISRTVSNEKFKFLLKSNAVKDEYFGNYIKETLLNNTLDLKTFDNESISSTEINSKRPAKFIMPIDILEFKELSSKLKKVYPKLKLQKIHLTFRFILKSSNADIESFNNLVVVKNIIPFNPPAY